MGQRLVINIRDEEGNILANAYYHWSAYTMSALSIIKGMIESKSCQDYLLSTEHTYNEKVSYAINMLAETGASLTENSREYIKTININSGNLLQNAFEECNRNDGLIGVGEGETNQLLSCSEGTVDVDIDTQKIDFYELLYQLTISNASDEDKICFISDILDINGDCIDDSGIDKLLNIAIDNLRESNSINKFYDICSLDFKDIPDFYTDLSNVGFNFAMYDESGELTFYSKIE